MVVAIGMEEMIKTQGNEIDAMKTKAEMLEADIQTRKEHQQGLEIELEKVMKENTKLGSELNTVKDEKKVIEENISAKRVSELEAKVKRLQARVSAAKTVLSTSQEAHKAIVSAFDKHE